MRKAVSRRVALILLTLVSVYGFWGGEAWGQIAAWQLNSAAGNETTINATTLDANLNNSSLTRGSGINATALVQTYNSSNYTVSGTKANAISANKFVYFIINAKAGYQVSLSTLDARFRRSSAGPNAFRWQYSIDGTNFTDIGSADISFSSTNTDGVAQTQIDLSVISALQNVTNSVTITIRLLGWGATNTGGTFAIGRSLTSAPTDYSLAIGGSVTALTSDPTISVSPSSLSGFTYVLGSGPSAQQSFTVSGTNLTNNIVITPPADYEIATVSGGPFTSGSVTLNQTGGIVNSTPIYVRLKAGLAINTYVQNIDITSSGASDKAVSCSGSVTAPILVVISQIYGGGGNAGASYQNDYIELFNRGTTSVSLNGKSVQYASATGNSWTVISLPNTTLSPGQYYLIKLASDGLVGASLPASDLTNTSVNISATTGKVALCNSTTALSENCPTGIVILDFVGYGTNADCREGASSANNAPAGSNTISLFRVNNGCTDTDNNAADFTAAAPVPRNTSSPANPCTTPTITISTATLTGFTYILGNGPSAEQSFTVSGTNLTANISITAPTNYQISTGTGALFVPTSPITLTPIGGILASTTIYVRLKAGLAAGIYNGEIINITSAGATAKTVTCSGYVTCSAISILASNTAYTEDFNTLANTGTSSYVPCGWAFNESGTGNNTIYSAGDGSSVNGDTYSFGAGTNTDRAFGGLLSTTLISTIGASYQNNTGDVINTVSIQYTGEQWRLGAVGREDRLDFQYSVNATSITTGTWTNFDPLDFIAPVTAGTVGSLDGNNTANKALISANLIGLSIPNGAAFWIRWVDYDASGSDDGLGVDDFSLTALIPCAISVSGFAPASGPAGTQVTISGNNFTGITNVQFNGINSSFVVNSSTQITATVPPGNTAGFITVINNAPCSVSSATGFVTISTDCAYAPELIISEYVEGSSTNKAIEIVNLTSGTINLSGYNIVMYFNGFSSIGNTVNLPGDNLPVNGVYVVVPGDADQALKDKANFLAPASGWFNGDDAVVLRNGSTNIDIFGNIGCDPGTAWTDGSTTTVNHTLVRKNEVYTGITVDPANTDCLFPTLASEWDQYDQDDFSHLGTHGASAGIPPTLTSLNPQVVCEGGVASFSITASAGNPPFTFVWKVLDNSGLWTTVVDGGFYSISGDATSSTLSILNAPSGYHNYQYYCAVTNSENACFTASNAAKLSVANLWIGTTPNWETNTNWNCGTPPSSLTNVIIPTIPSGGSMPVINKLISADCKNIEIQANATVTINSDGLGRNGSLVVTGTYTGPGKVKYNRYLTPAPDLPSTIRRWFIISSPVNTSLGGFDGSAIVHNGSFDYDFAPYSEPENDWKYQTSLPNNLANGQGYLARVSGDGILKFTGSLNNSDVTIAVTGNSTYGWNAVGNPFTSAIGITDNALTMDKFLDKNIGILDPSYRAIYLWYQTDGISTGTGTGSYAPGDQYYRTINNIAYSGNYYGGPISADYVQAGQGFLVNVSTNGTIRFTKNNENGSAGMQFHSDTLTLKKSTPSWPGLTLLATHNGKTRSTILAFNDKMTTGLDPSYDAGLFPASGFNLYTHLVSGDNETDFSIQSLPDNMYASLVIPLGLDVPQAGTVTLKTSGIILPDGIYPVIEDRLLQQSIALKTETDSLAFVLAEAARGTGRFFLHFGETQTNTGISHPQPVKLIARYNRGSVILSGTPETGSRALLYDMNGRKLSSEYRLAPANLNEIPAPGLSPGIYLLRIEGKTTRQTIKITVISN